jgi:hypothetical protein
LAMSSRLPVLAVQKVYANEVVLVTDSILARFPLNSELYSLLKSRRFALYDRRVTLPRRTCTRRSDER